MIKEQKLYTELTPRTCLITLRERDQKKEVKTKQKKKMKKIPESVSLENSNVHAFFRSVPSVRKLWNPPLKWKEDILTDRENPGSIDVTHGDQNVYPNVYGILRVMTKLIVSMCERNIIPHPPTRVHFSPQQKIKRRVNDQKKDEKEKKQSRTCS